MITTAAQAAVDPDCTRLVRVDINDDEILSSSETRSLVSPFLQLCIDAALIQRLLGAVSNHFIESGYVTTRPYLEEQDISDGQILIQVLVGKIEAIINAETGLADAKIATAFAFHDEILNLRSLETALESIERVPSVKAEFEVRPGRQQGHSIVAIKSRESDRLHLAWGINAQTDLDSRISLQASLDNPFNINDILELNLNSGEVRETFQSNRSEELSYSFPLGNSLFVLSHSEVSFEQRLQGLNESFLSRGETLSDRLQIRNLIHRDQSYKLTFSTTLELKDTENFFEDQLIDVSSYKTSQLQLALGQQWFYRWGYLTTGIHYHRGLDSFGARDDEFFSTQANSTTDARLQFEKTVVDGHLLYQFEDSSWQLSSQWLLQYSEDTLFDNDRVNLGSPFTVRGYASALAGSNAWYWRNDFTRQLFDVFDSTAGQRFTKQFSLSLGFDYGEVKCESDNADVCGEIYGLGLGLSLSDRNFNARLLWGHPLKEIGEDIGDKDQYYLDLFWRF